VNRDEIRRAAADVDWQEQAACANTPIGVWVPPTETAAGLALARTWCDLCPVVQECLMWALLMRAEGFWGGTSTYQRAQLVRVRNRAKCPLCRSRELAHVDRHGLCRSCGASWDLEDPTTPAGQLPAA